MTRNRGCTDQLIPKDQFMTEVINYITSVGFINDENDKDLYIRTFSAQGRAMTMTINGQTVQQHAPIVVIKQVCDLWGFGSIDDKEFLEVGFKLKENDETTINYIECFYLDEIEFFKEILHAIFKL